MGDISIDLLRRQVKRNGIEIRLSATEFGLLAFLARQPDQVLARERILKAVWGYDFDGYPRVLETYISYLRKKIDAQGTPLLHTVRGVGYSLRLPKE